MKEITLFLLNNCPHCKLALRLQEELLAEHPAWRDIPLRMVDEAAEPAYADTFDYYYVPCYYVDGVKVHEQGYRSKRRSFLVPRSWCRPRWRGTARPLHRRW